MKLDDGRFVKLHSEEHKAQTAAKKAAEGVPDSVTTDVDGEQATVSFTPPPPSIGTPKKDPESAPGKKTRSKKEEQADEVEDYKQLVAAFFYGIAAATGTPEYAFAELECEAVARPLSRIATRNARIRKVVQQVADPVALVTAVALPLIGKHAAAERRKKQPRMQAASDAPVTNIRTQSSEPPPPPQNGVVPMASVLNRISEGS